MSDFFVQKIIFLLQNYVKYSKMYNEVNLGLFSNFSQKNLGRRSLWDLQMQQLSDLEWGLCFSGLSALSLSAK